MVRSIFDGKGILEVVGDLVSERTDPGDSIRLLIKYRGQEKPLIVLEFNSYNPDKSKLARKEDLTYLLPAKPYYDVIDPSTGRAYTDAVRQGYEDWRQLVNNPNGLGPAIQKICKAGGRNFSYEDLV